MYKSEVIGAGGISARVVAHSVAANTGTPIVTFELTYPRFIHSEFLTHRLFSRNAASSRAIPVDKVIEAVREKPAMPIHWGKNQPGMQAEEECDALIRKISGESFERDEWWKISSDLICNQAEMFSEAGYHKQIVNRLLEPFQFMKTVVTATEFDNFFALRRHPDAQPEIQELAECMWEALQHSEPEVLEEGEWHVPYVPTIKFDNSNRIYCAWVKEFDDKDKTVTFEEITEEQALKVSASCCAQVSFRKSDTSVEKAERIYDMLVNSKPVHCYDEKTEVLTKDGFKFWKDINSSDCLASVDSKSGKFIGFSTPKNLVAEYYEGDVYEYNQRDFNLVVTPDHKLYGSKGRKPTQKFELFKANQPTSHRHSHDTYGQAQFRNPLTTTGVANESQDASSFHKGAFLGMFVGDGFVPDDGSRSVVMFRFKKERKALYLKSLLDHLGYEWSTKEHEGVTVFRVKSENLGNIMKDQCYTSDSKKKLPSYVFDKCSDFINGVFDGLMNSDGSIKRKTYVYSTSSEVLRDQVEVLCVIGGFGSCHIDTQGGCGGNPNYRLMIRTKKSALLNDSRRPNDACIVRHYKGMVYCAEVEGNVLIVRREGKICLSGNSSPFEHQAKPIPDCSWEFELDAPDNPMLEQAPEGITHECRKGKLWSGNFCNWIQHRQLIPENTVWEYEDA